MAELILHHYWTSPFTEKVRLALGLKGVAWRSVEQPNIMPKPDLTPLTGGYRKIPVLQIGADIFCDSQCILRKIERLHPAPSLYPDGAEATHWATAFWADRVLFQAVVAVVFGEMADSVPKEFIADREKLSGRPFDVNQMKAAVPMMKEQLRAQLGWIDAQLTDGRAYLLGARASLSDFATYHSIWFLQSYYPPAGAILEAHARTRSWLERVKKIGHGTHSPMSTANAVAVAKAATPVTQPGVDPGEPNGWRVGDRVAVMADDYGRDPIAGEIVRATAQEIAIRRSDPAVGDVVVHFPRAGFFVVRS